MRRKPATIWRQSPAEYLTLAETLAGKAGGAAPLPEAPKTTKLADLRARVGNDRLKGLLDEADALKPEVAKWKKQAELAAKRVPEWERLQKFLSAGAGVGALAEAETAAKGILDGRLLLDNSDHVPPLLKQAAQSAAHGGNGRAWRVRQAPRRTAHGTGGERSLAENFRHATHRHHERGRHFVRARSGSRLGRATAVRAPTDAGVELERQDGGVDGAIPERGAQGGESCSNPRRNT